MFTIRLLCAQLPCIQIYKQVTARITPFSFRRKHQIPLPRFCPKYTKFCESLSFQTNVIIERQHTRYRTWRADEIFCMFSGLVHILKTLIASVGEVALKGKGGGLQTWGRQVGKMGSWILQRNSSASRVTRSTVRNNNYTMCSVGC